MAHLRLGIAGLLLLALTGGCSSGRRSPEDPLTRILAAREPYVGRYVAAEGETRTKAGPDVLEVRADGMLEQRGPVAHVFTAAWEPLDDRRITARPNGAAWQRVYTLRPHVIPPATVLGSPAARPTDGAFTAVDQTD